MNFKLSWVWLIYDTLHIQHITNRRIWEKNILKLEKGKDTVSIRAQIGKVLGIFLG